jgi:two-component system response regulator HydG
MSDAIGGRPVSVVVVDDEESVGRALELALRREGFQAASFTEPEQALAAVCDGFVDVVVTDVKMAGLSGLELLRAVKERRPEVEVLMMSGHATVQIAVEAVKSGAYDFVTKPFEDVDVVLRIVRRAGERKRLLDRNRALEAYVADRERDMGIVGRSPRVEELRRMIATVGRSHSTVLIRGESGTGKELVARALHAASDRAGKPFVAVNCSALTETLLESELFGHVKGAFTGAVGTRRGLFEQADGGTIFLDEIGDISPALQVRLLRVLQEGEVRKVGATSSDRLDVRVITATNVDLEKAVDLGRFRQDLYYRLNVISLTVPALRDRAEDIPVLAQHFLVRFAAQSGRTVRRMGPDFVEAVVGHTFPGNVRELENLIERAVVLAQGEELTRAELPSELRPGAVVLGETGTLSELPYAEARRVMLRNFERRYFSTLLRRHGNNLTAAARSAGMDRSNFRRSLKASGLRSPGSQDDDPAREAAG